jgi:outer membrane protein OmpA-like peptidoglycan-associated protein
MKKRKIILILGMFLFLVPISGSLQAQVEDPGKKTEKEAEKRVNKNVDKGIKKGFDEIEKGIGGLFKKKQSNSNENDAGESDDDLQAGDDGSQSSALVWAKYDFIPGDKIIFEDNLTGEENGEFPTRWDLENGTVENAQFGGENVIMFRGNSTTIVPYLKNSNIDYLPEVFTVEFDLYIPNNSFKVYFYDRKNQKPTRGNTALDISRHTMTLGPARSKLAGDESIAERWAHISIAYTNGKLKAYIDETRLINIPHADFDPTGISLHAYHASANNPYFVKNVRIAEGGVKYYDRFLQDGKIVSNGIRFDVGKASLRPESMGVLNEIYKMLSEHPDVNVSVEGHTDSDGDNDLNQKLSEDRAGTVMKQLISMGISADRLSSKGFGESMPVNTNATPEGKAENRRVEFVRM